MSGEFDQLQGAQERQSLSRREPAEFQEAPGEDEAEASREAFLKSAGPDPAGQAAALANADGSTRAHAVGRLQRQRGNAYVQRVVNQARGIAGRLVGLGQSEMVNEVLQRKGGGEPLPSPARTSLEDHFGADLSGVRVHNDDESHALNRELDAQAFTVGSDVFMAQGKYDPASREGQGLLAHEITHVGQQTGFGGQSVQRAAEEEEPKPADQAGAVEPAAPVKKPEEEAAA